MGTHRKGVADCRGEFIDESEAVANARLIAAAPAMFKKLSEYVCAFPDQEALDIIAEVEGRQ